MNIEEKLSLNKFDVFEKPHIKVNIELCRKCHNSPCLFVCPAGCFNKGVDAQEKREKIVFSYEGCLECGSCRLVCENGAIEWNYPPGGFGVCYQYG